MVISRGMMSKYPFNPESQTEASLADVDGILKPGTGSLWKFYDQNLQQSLPKRGPSYYSCARNRRRRHSYSGIR